MQIPSSKRHEPPRTRGPRARPPQTTPRVVDTLSGCSLSVCSLSVCSLGVGLWLLAAGCEGPSEPAWQISPAGSRTASPTQVPSPAITLSPSTLVAADPELPGFDGWPLVFEARTTHASERCRAQLSREGAVIATSMGSLSGTTCTALWDGHGESGARLAPGPVEVEGQILDASGSVRARVRDRVEIVRVGIDRIDLSGEVGARQPLLYRAMGGRRDGWFEMPIDFTPFAMGPDDGESGSSALELADGSARPIPAPWAELTTPPLEGSAVEDDLYNLPTAWVIGARISYAVHLSTDLAGVPGGGDPTITEVRLLAPEGLMVEGEARVRDDATVTLAGVPVVSVARHDVTHAFGFEARRPGGEWQPMPGAFPVTLRMYGLIDEPVFARTTIPHRPWVDVLDTIMGWASGGASGVIDSPDEVGALIVDGVYNDSGLRYDTRAGASHYSEYTSGWSNAVFSMQSFQTRRYGEVINCSDAAAIVSAYANMVGLDFRYRILTHRTADSFRLNYLQGIGSPTFTASPFDSGRAAFRYHAIVNSRDARTWDATLAVDGDGTPSAAPFTQRLVTGLPPADYLAALSPEAANILTQVDENVRIQ